MRNCKTWCVQVPTTVMTWRLGGVKATQEKTGRPPTLWIGEEWCRLRSPQKPLRWRSAIDGLLGRALGDTTSEEVKEAELGNGSWAVIQSQQRYRIPQGTLDLRRPFRFVPSWSWAFIYPQGLGQAALFSQFSGRVSAVETSTGKLPTAWEQVPRIRGHTTASTTEQQKDVNSFSYQSISSCQ